MVEAMDILQLGTLAMLALIDSTSFGTLAIPLFLLLAPGRIRVGRVLVFLGTVAGLYFVIGLALLAGMSAAMPTIDAWLQTRPGAFVLLAAGVALFVGSWLIPGRKAYEQRRAASEARGETLPPGRLMRARDRAVSGEGGLGYLMGVAAFAVGLEAATMLPYVGAIGLMSAADITPAARVTVLAGYCLVMVTPALALLLVRVILAEQVRPALTRLADFVERNAGESVSWIVGIAGFLIARHGFMVLGGFYGLFGP